MDTSTSSLTGANGQVFYFANPTANSAATFALSSINTVAIQVNIIGAGGTLVVEVSMDGQTFWLRPNVFQISTQNYTNSFTAPFSVIANTSGMTHIRVRAITSWTGNATVIVKETLNNHSLTIESALPIGTNSIGQITANAGTNLNTSALALSATQTNGTQKSQVIDGSGNIQPSGDILTRKIFVQPTDGSNNQGFTASNEAKVLVTPLTNSSIVKAQITDGIGIQNPARPDSQIKVAMDSTTLFYDTFDSTLDVTTKWSTTGSPIPTSSSGQLTIGAGTTALAFSALQSQPTFQLLGNNFNHAIAILKFDSGLKTGNYRFFGLGIQAASPTVAIPMLDGTGFQWDGTTGVLSGVVWSSSTQSQSISLSTSQPTDGAFHRYAIFYKTSRVYFELDNVVVGSIAYPNPTLSVLPILNISINGAATVSPAAIFISSFSGMGDTSRTNYFLSDSAFPWRKATIDVFGNQSTSVMAIASGYYSAPVNIRQTTTTAANATVWAMRNAAASTKTVYIERIQLLMAFDTATPLGRSLQRYDLVRFTTATPTAGTAITVVAMDSSSVATQVTDVRFVDTGLITTSVAFGTAIATIGCPATDATTAKYERTGISIKLAPGEGLCLRLDVTAVVGQSITGEIVWSER